MDEISQPCVMDRIFFAGSFPCRNYLHLLQISTCHVYSAHPFVLSLSLLEAMSVVNPLVASFMAPINEVIESNIADLLVGIFPPD